MELVYMNPSSTLTHHWFLISVAVLHPKFHSKKYTPAIYFFTTQNTMPVIHATSMGTFSLVWVRSVIHSSIHRFLALHRALNPSIGIFGNSTSLVHMWCTGRCGGSPEGFAPLSFSHAIPAVETLDRRCGQTTTDQPLWFAPSTQLSAPCFVHY